MANVGGSIAEINELKAEIERLTAERDTAEGILEQLQNKFAAVTADNEMLRDELEQQYARVEKLEDAINERGRCFDPFGCREPYLCVWCGMQPEETEDELE